MTPWSCPSRSSSSAASTRRGAWSQWQPRTVARDGLRLELAYFDKGECLVPVTASYSGVWRLRLHAPLRGSSF